MLATKDTNSNKKKISHLLFNRYIYIIDMETSGMVNL